MKIGGGGGGGGSFSGDAADVTYDNATSGLTATDVQAALDELAASGGGGAGAPYGARVHRTTNLSIANATNVPVQWEVEDRDDAGYVDLGANDDRFTIPADGWYVLNGGLRWDSNGTGPRQLWWEKNGTDLIGSYAIKTETYASLESTTIVYLEAGDYVRLMARQNSGATRDIDVTFVLPYAAIHNLGGAQAFSGCKLTKSATQAVSSTPADITWDGEEYDTDGYHDNATDNSRITVPTDGYYLFTAMAQLSAGGFQSITLRVNGGAKTALADQALGVNYGTGSRYAVSGQGFLNAGDYVEVRQVNTGNGTFGTTPSNGVYFACTKLGT
jgi:hypothetical protein